MSKHLRRRHAGNGTDVTDAGRRARGPATAIAQALVLLATGLAIGVVPVVQAPSAYADAEFGLCGWSDQAAWMTANYAIWGVPRMALAPARASGSGGAAGSAGTSVTELGRQAGWDAGYRLGGFYGEVAGWADGSGLVDGWNDHGDAGSNAYLDDRAVAWRDFADANLDKAYQSYRAGAPGTPLTRQEFVTAYLGAARVTFDFGFIEAYRPAYAAAFEDASGVAPQDARVLGTAAYRDGLLRGANAAAAQGTETGTEVGRSAGALGRAPAPAADIHKPFFAADLARFIGGEAPPSGTPEDRDAYVRGLHDGFTQDYAQHFAAGFERGHASELGRLAELRNAEIAEHAADAARVAAAEAASDRGLATGTLLSGGDEAAVYQALAEAIDQNVARDLDLDRDDRLSGALDDGQIVDSERARWLDAFDDGYRVHYTRVFVEQALVGLGEMNAVFDLPEGRTAFQQMLGEAGLNGALAANDVLDQRVAEHLGRAAGEAAGSPANALEEAFARYEANISVMADEGAREALEHAVGRDPYPQNASEGVRAAWRFQFMRAYRNFVVLAFTRPYAEAYFDAAGIEPGAAEPVVRGLEHGAAAGVDAFKLRPQLPYVDVLEADLQRALGDPDVVPEEWGDARRAEFRRGYQLAHALAVVGQGAVTADGAELPRNFSEWELGAEGGRQAGWEAGRAAGAESGHRAIGSNVSEAHNQSFAADYRRDFGPNWMRDMAARPLASATGGAGFADGYVEAFRNAYRHAYAQAWLRAYLEEPVRYILGPDDGGGGGTGGEAAYQAGREAGGANARAANTAGDAARTAAADAAPAGPLSHEAWTNLYLAASETAGQDATRIALRHPDAPTGFGSTAWRQGYREAYLERFNRVFSDTFDDEFYRLGGVDADVVGTEARIRAMALSSGERMGAGMAVLFGGYDFLDLEHAGADVVATEENLRREIQKRLGEMRLIDSANPGEIGAYFDEDMARLRAGGFPAFETLPPAERQRLAAVYREQFRTTYVRALVPTVVDSYVRIFFPDAGAGTGASNGSSRPGTLALESGTPARPVSQPAVPAGMAEWAGHPWPDPNPVFGRRFWQGTAVAGLALAVAWQVACAPGGGEKRTPGDTPFADEMLQQVRSLSAQVADAQTERRIRDAARAVQDVLADYYDLLEDGLDPERSLSKAERSRLAGRMEQLVVTAAQAEEAAATLGAAASELVATLGAFRQSLLATAFALAQGDPELRGYADSLQSQMLSARRRTAALLRAGEADFQRLLNTPVLRRDVVQGAPLPQTSQLAEDDFDGDGLSDEDETGRYRTDPQLADTDLDGVRDGAEVERWRTDPLDPDDVRTDQDFDGLSDAGEAAAGTKIRDRDSDRDGALDGEELDLGTDPLDASSKPSAQARVDADGDGLSDVSEVLIGSRVDRRDTDGDGAEDAGEVARGTDPVVASTTDGYTYDGVRAAVDFTGVPARHSQNYRYGERCWAWYAYQGGSRDNDSRINADLLGDAVGCATGTALPSSAGGEDVAAVRSACARVNAACVDAVQNTWRKVLNNGASLTYANYRRNLYGQLDKSVVSAWQFSNQSAYLLGSRPSGSGADRMCLTAKPIEDAAAGDASPLSDIEVDGGREVTLRKCDFDATSSAGLRQVWAFAPGTDQIQNHLLAVGDRGELCLGAVDNEVALVPCRQHTLGSAAVTGQSWSWLPGGYLVHKRTGKCLDLADTEPGEKVVLTDCRFDRASGDEQYDTPGGYANDDPKESSPVTRQVWQLRSLGDVSLSAQGAGKGTVTVTADGTESTLIHSKAAAEVESPDGDGCSFPGACLVAAGEPVTMVAAAGEGSVFAGWSGACEGSGPRCVLQAGDASFATAAVFIPTTGLTVAVTGAGRVTSDRGGIDCGSPGAGADLCAVQIEGSEPVVLTAEPDQGQVFVGWDGACDGAAPTCAVSPTVSDGELGVSAVFAQPVTVKVSKSGAGHGSVTGPGLDCPGACTEDSVERGAGAVVSLRAEASDGSVFAGWAGACEGSTAATCEVAAAEGLVVTPRFLPATAVRVSVTGPGSGIVEGGAAGTAKAIACPGSGGGCRTDVGVGTQVRLVADPDDGSVFVAWSGACAQTTGPVCAVMVERDVEVAAKFAPEVELKVSAHGPGRVVVPGGAGGTGADCEAVASPCVTAQARNVPVALTAVPADGFVLTGWAAPCKEADAAEADSSVCTVTPDEAAVAHAYFEAGTELAVEATGTGQGTVVSRLPGIDCTVASDACGRIYRTGETVELLAVPSSGSVFGGWDGPCEGAGAGPTRSCTVRLSGTEAVALKPRFQVEPGSNLRRLRLDLRGAGGVVTSRPTGIACGGGEVCEHFYPRDAEVKLTAQRGFDTKFTGWGGTCPQPAGDTCTVRLADAVTVKPTFATVAKNAKKPVSVSRTGQGLGTIATLGETGTVEGLSCGAICAGAFYLDTMVTLRALPSVGSAFTGWSGACQGQGAECRLVVGEDNQTSANFAPALNMDVGVRAEGGTGIVTSQPGGISCVVSDGVCSSAFAQDSQVTLRAAPAPGSAFQRWTGACSGTQPTCIVTMAGGRSAGATFGTAPAPSQPPSNPVSRAPRCGGRPATIVGTARSETLVGTRGPDVIVGLGGNDRIRGLGGNDLICGGPGAGVLDGGSGNDRLWGGSGRDRLIGGAGNDVLSGAGGNDLINGGAGSDRLVGGGGRDVCVGGKGRDRAYSCERKKSVP